LGDVPSESESSSEDTDAEYDHLEADSQQQPSFLNLEDYFDLSTDKYDWLF